MLQDILNAANKYDEGLKQVQHRRGQWMKRSAEIKEHLKKTADYLNANALYKPGYYVDSLRAFDEQLNGECVEMPSIIFRSGDVPMMIEFVNEKGEKKAFTEKGFQVTFNPLVTGQVVVLLMPHHSDASQKELPYINIAIIDDLEELNENALDHILAQAIEAAFFTSFTGIADSQEEEDGQAPSPPPAHPYTPIGFKRYETTEARNRKPGIK